MQAIQATSSSTNKTKTPPTPSTVLSVSNPTTSDELFGFFYNTANAPGNEYLAKTLPSNVCDPADKDHNTHFDPKHPNQAIPGNISETEDTRIWYDAPRRRYWIATHLRNLLYCCDKQPDGSDAGACVGMRNPDETAVDPDPNDPTKHNHKCHHDWDASWAHRFIGVAVTESNLSKPFHRYVLVDEYCDWPLMTVNGNYLILTEHISADNPGTVNVFDAEKLANGEEDNSFMKVKPLDRLSYACFVIKIGSATIPATGRIMLVNHHGDSDGLTYLLSTNGESLLVFALAQPADDPSGKPSLLEGALVDLGRELSGVHTNPVYSNGKIYIVGYDITDPDRYDMHTFRLSVGRSNDGSSVSASEDFHHHHIATGSQSFVEPALEVTKDGDIVASFMRIGLHPTNLSPADARYSVWYSGESRFRDSAELHDHVGEQIPDPTIPRVDLTGTALDPADNQTVWMSQVFSDNGTPTLAVAAVKP